MNVRGEGDVKGIINVIVVVAGGRFKKEIVVDGQSYLLLIRDEGGPPELQVPDISFSSFG